MYYDAVHLAAARFWQSSLGEPVTLATYDRQLWQAGDAAGLGAWPPGGISQTTGSAYKRAMALLVQLHDLAVYQAQEAGFEQRLGQIYAQHNCRAALMRRLREAGLHPPSVIEV